MSWGSLALCPIPPNVHMHIHTRQNKTRQGNKQATHTKALTVSRGCLYGQSGACVDPKLKRDALCCCAVLLPPLSLDALHSLCLRTLPLLLLLLLLLLGVQMLQARLCFLCVFFTKLPVFPVWKPAGGGVKS